MASFTPIPNLPGFSASDDGRVIKAAGMLFRRLADGRIRVRHPSGHSEIIRPADLNQQRQGLQVRRDELIEDIQRFDTMRTALQALAASSETD